VTRDFRRGAPPRRERGAQLSGRHPESLGRWIDYDPSWLVLEAAQRLPDRSEIQEALSRCQRAKWESNAYLYFEDASRPNKPGSSWEFDESVILESTSEGDLVLDLLKGNRVGGVEFLDRL
jgi:hypothetical protein